MPDKKHKFNVYQYWYIKVKTDDEHSTDIKLDDIYTLKMKYPSLDEFIKSNFNFETNMNVDDTFDLIASCIDQVYQMKILVSSGMHKRIESICWSIKFFQFKEVEKFLKQCQIISHIKVINPNTMSKVNGIRGVAEFFRISMAHEDLVSYYKLNFSLMHIINIF